MALYTTTNIQRSPNVYNAPNTNVSALPIELLATLAWRSAKHQLPLTPPHSAAPPRRVSPPQMPAHTTLPPIAHLDSQLARLSPGASRILSSVSVRASELLVNLVTPPQADDASQWHTYGPAAVKLPPMQSLSCTESPVYTNGYRHEQMQLVSPSPSPEVEPIPQVLDWFIPSKHRPNHFLAEKTCEMVCYLWFSTLSRDASPRHDRKFPRPNSATAALQFAVAPEFVRFMQKVLETTQVSQSVIVLSLQYIYRLKERNRSTNGHAGSEYRVAIAALMMANKFVDDNTYTNKTWSDVSGIALEEINRMEREFLQGIDFDLYVDEPSYQTWLNLLKGLVLAKERDSRHWCRSSRPRASVQSKPHRSARVSHQAARSQRARSSSPHRYTVPCPAVVSQYSLPAVTAEPSTYTPRSGSKRSATDAFSPTSTSFEALRPLKRPTGLSLDIPQYSQGPSSSHSASPLEPLHSFSKLSLGASPAVIRPTPRRASPGWPSVAQQNVAPQTLASAYQVDDKRQSAAPQNLYFYALACSPTEEESRTRKARLRYHQPPTTSAEYGYAMQSTVPMVVQSACASPHEGHTRLPARPPTLPHFSEIAWERPRTSAPRPQTYHSPEVSMQQPLCENGVQSAPFANAGPPGVQFYINNTVQQPTPEYNWAPRSRRL
ncbi:hypothetical protein EIP86_005834 [Pleurotus ostreatoroseus]|nr:hypothetical protein EIP86_005834 [Pleurotus ostreatoroseus]